MDQLVAGLILAAVTSAAIFAYRHPNAFERISDPILCILLALFVIFGFWNLAHLAARDAATKGLSYANEFRDVVTAGVNGNMVPGSYFLVVFLVGLYLMFLQALPLLKEMDKEPSKPSGDDKSKNEG